MENLVNKFDGIPVACVVDVMNGDNVLNSTIRPLSDQYRFVGRALTVEMEERDNYSIFKGIKRSKPGDILVINAKGNCNYAVVGDFMVGLMKSLHIGAVVIDGAVRDLAKLKELGFPVFCKDSTPIASGRATGGDINVPITCGGICVHPEDIVLGDADGIVVVPQTIEESILTKALEKQVKDKERDQVINCSSNSIREYIDSILK